jgi:serine/threonine protein kinase
MAELLIKRDIKHVAGIREVFHDEKYPSHYFIVMEYCNHTNLYDQIYTERCKL